MGSPNEISCFFSFKTTEYESYFSQAGSSICEKFRCGFIPIVLNSGRKPPPPPPPGPFCVQRTLIVAQTQVKLKKEHNVAQGTGTSSLNLALVFGSYILILILPLLPKNFVSLFPHL